MLDQYSIFIPNSYTVCPYPYFDWLWLGGLPASNDAKYSFAAQHIRSGRFQEHKEINATGIGADKQYKYESDSQTMNNLNIP